MKKTGWASIMFAAMLLAVAAIAEAQQPKKVHRIGYLSVLDPAREPPVPRQFGWPCESLVT
jgi:hypothetical protein